MENYNSIVKDVMNFVKENHPYLYMNNSKDTFDDFFSKLESINISDETECIYYIQKLLKLINDPHTTIQTYSVLIPIEFRVINNKVIVINALNEYSDLIGTQLLSINNRNIDEICFEKSELISSLVDERKNYMLGKQLMNLFNLYSLPSMKKCEEFIYKFSNGKEFTFNINSKYDLSNYYNRSCYDYEIKNDTLIIKYEKCKNIDNYPFVQFVDDIKSIVLKNNISSFIVDLRQNAGGNSLIINPLIEFLKNKKTVTLIDEGVFSSGSLAVCDLINIGSMLIGDYIGTPLNCFGDIVKKQIGNYVINCSTKYFYYDYDKKEMCSVLNSDFEKFYLNPDNKKYFDIQIIKPDILIPYTEKDYNGDEMIRIALEKINE